MTHAVSAASMKSGRTLSAAHDAPNSGTRIRAIYDELFDNAGHWFIPTTPWTSSTTSTMQYLRDNYSLDIRCRGNGRGHAFWLLAGEYVGRGYLDYVADPSLARGPNQC